MEIKLFHGHIYCYVDCYACKSFVIHCYKFTSIFLYKSTNVC